MAEPEKKDEKKVVEPTAAEVKASSGGWVPETEWKGDSDDWVPAKEFNFRGELMARINEQSSILNNFKNQIAERDTVITDLGKMHTNIADREYKKALKNLREEKAVAVDDGDGSKVVTIEEQIDELKERKVEADKPVVPAAPDTPKEVVDWLQEPRNQWYNTDDFLRRFADGIAKGIMDKDPNVTPANLLVRMEKQIKEELPHKFGGGNTSVDDGGGDAKSRDRSNSKKPKFSDLDEDQQACAKRFAKLDVMTVEEYIDELVAQGEF